MVDNLFLFAVGALGWGLSLATYSLVARRQQWPMGALQIDFPAVPAVIGLVAVLTALAFAVDRGPESGGWVIVIFGILLAIFWTGFLRVGSQVSLLLAPVAIGVSCCRLAQPSRARGSRERVRVAARNVPRDRKRIALRCAQTCTQVARCSFHSPLLITSFLTATVLCSD